MTLTRDVLINVVLVSCCLKVLYLGVKGSDGLLHIIFTLLSIAFKESDGRSRLRFEVEIFNILVIMIGLCKLTPAEILLRSFHCCALISITVALVTSYVE